MKIGVNLVWVCCAVLLWAVSDVGKARAADLPLRTNKYVFAHYMVCIPTYGGQSTVEDYKREIIDAQKRGIDGFVLNCGEWDKSYYKKRSEQIYQAARELNSGFQLFYSADFATTLTVENMRDMIDGFRSHPNQFKVDGKPVLSTFCGQAKCKMAVDLIQQEFQGDRAIVFVPFSYPKPAAENPDVAGVQQVFDALPMLDGFFHFGAAGTPAKIARTNSLAAQKWLGAGKIFMAGISPFYHGSKGNYRIFEYNGFEGMAQLWEGAIRDNATWVELVTWNDWGECSYVAPLASQEEQARRNIPWLKDKLPHEAYLEASDYYIRWFKTGRAPAIERDALYYFYRLAPKSIKEDSPTAPNGQPSGFNTLQDKVFVSLFLKEPADLTIYSGATQQDFHMAAGAQNVSIAFAPGSQRFVLKRSGKTLVDKIGEREITDKEPSPGFNYFSGSAKVAE